MESTTDAIYFSRLPYNFMPDGLLNFLFVRQNYIINSTLGRKLFCVCVHVYTYFGRVAFICWIHLAIQDPEEHTKEQKYKSMRLLFSHFDCVTLGQSNSKSHIIKNINVAEV